MGPRGVLFVALGAPLGVLCGPGGLGEVGVGSLGGPSVASGGGPLWLRAGSGGRSGCIFQLTGYVSTETVVSRGPRRA